MRVSRKRYAKKRDRSHNLHVNIRLRKRGSRPTHAEVITALNHILNHGKVPKGWQFASIDWARPTGGDKGWREGDISDVQNLDAVIRAMLDNARIGVVKK